MASMADVRRIVWSIYWKSALSGMLLGTLTGGLIGFVLGMIAGMSGGMTQSWLLAIQLCGLIAGAIVAFICFNFFFARAIGKNIAGKTLTLNEVGR